VPLGDAGKITLCRTGAMGEAASRWPQAGPLLTRRANRALIGDQWDDLLRLAASLKFGHATASLVVGKLSTSGPQNTQAGTEGVRAAPAHHLRRPVPLRRALLPGRSPASSTRASGDVNAVMAWTAEYLGLAVAELRSGGRRIDDEVLAHVSPAHNENIGFYGTFSEVASEPA